ncbi:hypothetical protein STEG23_018866 [Scotinomys teguina]
MFPLPKAEGTPESVTVSMEMSTSYPRGDIIEATLFHPLKPKLQKGTFCNISRPGAEGCGGGAVCRPLGAPGPEEAMSERFEKPFWKENRMSERRMRRE